MSLHNIPTAAGISTLSHVHVPEGSVMFCFEFESLAPQSPEVIAEELWDQMPVLQPPVMV